MINRDIRAALDAGAPADDYDLRRLALRATSRISDPAKAAFLHNRITDILHGLTAAQVIGPEAVADVRALLDETLDEIEAASQAH